MPGSSAGSISHQVADRIRSIGVGRVVALGRAGLVFAECEQLRSSFRLAEELNSLRKEYPTLEIRTLREWMFSTPAAQIDGMLCTEDLRRLSTALARNWESEGWLARVEIDNLYRMVANGSGPSASLDPNLEVVEESFDAPSL